MASGVSDGVLAALLRDREEITAIRFQLAQMAGNDQIQDQKLGVIDKLEMGRREEAEEKRRGEFLAVKDSQIVELRRELELVRERLPKMTLAEIDRQLGREPAEAEEAA